MIIVKTIYIAIHSIKLDFNLAGAFFLTSNTTDTKTQPSCHTTPLICQIHKKVLSLTENVCISSKYHNESNMAALATLPLAQVLAMRGVCGASLCQALAGNGLADALHLLL